MSIPNIFKKLSDIYHFLWFFGDKSDIYLQTVINRFTDFSSKEIDAIICLIFEVSNIIEITKDWILTDKGLISIIKNDDKIVYKIENQYEITESNYIYNWKENDNKWILNINNLESSKIIIKNNWKNQSKEQFIYIKYGNFILDKFLHNDRFILNISKDFIDKDDVFDIWDIDNYNYIINKKSSNGSDNGITEIYPLLFQCSLN